MTVARYYMDTYKGKKPRMAPSASGPYVRYESYQGLEIECRNLRAALKRTGVVIDARPSVTIDAVERIQKEANHETT